MLSIVGTIAATRTSTRYLNAESNRTVSVSDTLTKVDYSIMFLYDEKGETFFCLKEAIFMKSFKNFLYFISFFYCLVAHLNIANALSVVHPENGLYSLRPECALDKVLAVQGASRDWSSNVIIDNFSSSSSTWRLTRVDGDWYTITAIHSDLALKVADTQTATQAGNGLNVSTTPYRGESQSKFRFFDAGNGYYVIQACIQGEYVLDVFNRDNRAGTNVWCYSFNGTPAQKWRLERKTSINDPTFQQRTVTISDGWYRIQPMHDLGRSADAAGGNNNVHMWENLDVPQQKFYLQNRGNGYFSLQSAYGSKLFVTADGRGNGANLYTASWNNADSQLFRLIDAGNNSYHIFSKVGVNLNFDCAGGGTSNGNNVQLWTTEDNSWHKWRLTKVTADSKANFQLDSYSLSSPANYQLRFTGRLWNANNSSEITGIHVYIGGGVGAGGEFIGEFRADKSNHSFDSTINVPQNRIGNQLIVIYAVNGVESKELDRRNINISSVLTEWQWPINNVKITQKFANYYERKAKEGRPYHSGIDIKNANDNGHPPIYAAANGTVTYKNFTKSNGNHVIIKHNLNNKIVYTLYSHLDSFNGCPAVGQTVFRGQQIGTMGITGDSTGLHLHFAIFEGESTDPVGYAAQRNTSNLLSLIHNGKIFYDPEYVINNGRLP